MVTSISVALCTHNGARFIEAQLSSILRQSAPPHQIVISDDASSDDTVARARSVLERSHIEHIIFENSEPLGVARNFESAILATSGDLVALSDQDDLWHEDRLLRVLTEFEARPALDLVFGNARLVEESGASLDRTLFDVLEITTSDRLAVHRGGALPLLIKRNLATGATMMFRRRLMERSTPFPPYWVHDEWLAIMAAATGEIDLVDEPLIDYRQHAFNVIGVDFPTMGRKIRRALEPRGDRNQRIARQFEEFAQRLDSLGSGVSMQTLTDARTKAAFEESRQRLPASRLRRLLPILAADRCGLYSKFASQGRFDMVRDLLQSHGKRPNRPAG